jgi:hypothetical protein
MAPDIERSPPAFAEACIRNQTEHPHGRVRERFRDSLGPAREDGELLHFKHVSEWLADLQL